ncbi:10549_t:CDS:1, partial [Racocetra persica]
FNDPVSTHNPNVYEEINNELYLETSYIENYECTLTALQQELEEQENKECIIIKEFQ